MDEDDLTWMAGGDKSPVRRLRPCAGPVSTRKFVGFQRKFDEFHDINSAMFSAMLPWSKRLPHSVGSILQVTPARALASSNRCRALWPRVHLLGTQRT